MNPLVTSLSRAIKIFPGGQGVSLPIGKTWQLSSVLKLTWYKTLPAAWYYTPLPDTRQGKCSRNGCKQELRHVGEWQTLCEPWGREISLTRFAHHRYTYFVRCLFCPTTVKALLSGPGAYFFFGPWEGWMGGVPDRGKGGGGGGGEFGGLIERGRLFKNLFSAAGTVQYGKKSKWSHMQLDIVQVRLRNKIRQWYL